MAGFSCRRDRLGTGFGYLRRNSLVSSRVFIRSSAYFVGITSQLAQSFLEPGEKCQPVRSPYSCHLLACLLIRICFNGSRSFLFFLTAITFSEQWPNSATPPPSPSPPHTHTQGGPAYLFLLLPFILFFIV